MANITLTTSLNHYPYLLWLVKRSLVNKDYRAFINLTWGLVGVVVWVVVFFIFHDYF